MAQEGISTAQTYAWKIKNFTELKTEKRYSHVFLLGGYKWRLSAYPKGYHSDHYYFSLYLHVADSSALPDGWSRDIESLSLTVVDQVLARDSIVKSTKRRFCAQSTCWGSWNFVPLADLNDPAKGYLVDDTLVVHVCLSVSSEPFSILLNNSKNLLVEMSTMNRTQQAISSCEISDPQFLQKHRKKLQDYLELSLEAIGQANAFDKIERTARLIIQNSSNSLEKTILEDLVSRLASFKDILSTSKSIIKSLKPHRMSLARKNADVGARVDRRRERICTLETNFSNLAADVMGLEDYILWLTSQKEELLIRKNSVALELEKINKEASRDLEEWRNIRKETEEADKNWLQTREELAQANLSLKLFQQNLQQCPKSSKPCNHTARSPSSFCFSDRNICISFVVLFHISQLFLV